MPDKAPKAKARAQRASAAPEAAPIQVLGDDQRADTVAHALMHAQKMILDLAVQQRLNGDEDDEAIPGAEPQPGQERPQTYGERRAQLEDGCRLLMEDNSDLREEIEKVAAAWRTERDRQRAAAQPSSSQGE